MSDRSISITIGTTGSIRHVNGVRLAGEESKDKMYEPKQSKKMIRVLTVIAYMFTVSFAAIMLSVYYVFLWQPRDAERRNYVDVSSHKTSAAPRCPSTLDVAPPVRHVTTIAAVNVNEYQTTARVEVETQRPEFMTSRPVQRTIDTLITRGFVRSRYPPPQSDQQDYEDT